MNRLQLGVAALGALVSAALPRRVQAAGRGLSVKACQLVLSLQPEAAAATTLIFEAEGTRPHEWTCTASDASVIAAEVIPSGSSTQDLTLRIRTLKRGQSRLTMYSTLLAQGANMQIYVT
jgi:threonine/homoserine efflux transporter RhtA